MMSALTERRSRRRKVPEEANEDVLRVCGADDSGRRARVAKRPRKAHDGRTVRATSQFRGVTHHCRTQRWEAHIWQDGKQIYLGGFDEEEQAALAYDLAALKFRGPEAHINFDISNYEKELLTFNEITKDEVVQNLRRQSKGYQKTSSQYRGVTRHQKGKWEARIGQMVGKKYKYLGLFSTEVEAAQAYDRESVLRKGINAITNFDLSEYISLLNPEDAAIAVQRGLIIAQNVVNHNGGSAPASSGFHALDIALPLAANGPQQLQLPGGSAVFETSASGKRHHGSMQHAHTFEAPVLRCYSSMPTLPADRAAVATPFSLAVHSSKETPRQGITPKSVFEWQPGSLPATPTTPNDLLMQDPAGLQDGALEGVSTNEHTFGYVPSQYFPMIGQLDNSSITGGHLALLLQEWADAEVS